MLKSDQIIQSYVNICNEALQRNKERFPFKQILGAAQKSEKNKKIEVTVEGGSFNDSFVFTLKDEHITVQPHSACGDCQCERKWRVSREYLEKVAQHPSQYIANPAKINWEWIYDVRP